MKTFRGVRTLISQLQATKIEDQKECDYWSRRAKPASALLNSAWTNPAVEHEAATLRSELAAAWAAAMGAR